MTGNVTNRMSGFASGNFDTLILSGTATGVVNFLNFTFSALLGPVFGRILAGVSGGADRMTLEHYQTGFEPLLYGVGLAIVLTLFLKETGPAARRVASVAVREASTRPSGPVITASTTWVERSTSSERAAEASMPGGRS